MTRAIHGPPAKALRQAVKALAELSFGISWTSDPGLAPEPSVSARYMRDAAIALRKAARLFDAGADRADPPPDPGGADDDTAMEAAPSDNPAHASGHAMAGAP